MDTEVLKGKIALIQRGLDFALKQLANGVLQFKNVFNSDNCSDMEILLDDLNDGEDNASENEDDDNDSDDNDDGEDGDDDRSDMSYITGICPQFQRDSNGTDLWKYPEE